MNTTKITYAGLAVGAVLLGATVLRIARRKDGGEYNRFHWMSGIGGEGNGYVIMITRPDGYHNGVPLVKEEVFCGYSYRDREKWARWCDPYYRYGMEYDEKIFKTRKGAEKALQELIAFGESTNWDESEQYDLEVITWEEYVRRLRM